jgi:hypothetical protein
MPEPIFMILGFVYIMAPYSISVVYFTNASHQSVSAVASQLLDKHILTAMNV